ncbi:MAG: LEA type 2 family protein [Desulfosudaceae bacterium]
MNIGESIRLAGLLLLSGLVMSGCAMLEEAGMWEKPEARISAVRLTKLSFTGTDLEATVEVHNPNPYEINLGRLDYALLVQDKQVLKGEQNRNIDLKADSSQSLVFPVGVKFEDLLAAVSGLKQKSEVDYELTGGVSFVIPVAGEIRVPFNKKGRLPVPKMPKISVEKLRLDDLNMLGASLELILNLNNPNDFGINLDRFDYSFKLNGNPVAGGGATARVAAGPGQTSRIELPLDLSFASSGPALFKLLKDGGKLDYNLTIEGEVGSTHKLLNQIPLQTAKTGIIKLSR